MSDPGDRGKRPGGTPEGRRPPGGRPANGAPPQSRGPRREGSGKPSAASGGAGGGKDGERRLWTSGGKPARGDRDARERETPEDRDPFGTRSVRPHIEEPAIPEDVSPGDLDRIARNELKTLSKENAEGVAKHLVMAARLIETNPPLAHLHAQAAARRAGRIGVVRESLAITAYAVGDFALALRELRTHRRITGSNDQLPMMVDSERGLGRPEKALELGRSVSRSTLPVAVQVELAIAMSGARLDLGQTEAALTELEIPQLDPNTAFSYSPALFDAYATVLEELGRSAEADEWFERSDTATDLLDRGDSPDDVIEVIEEDVEWDATSVIDETGESSGLLGEEPSGD
jgi:hypothetical protein